MHSEALSESGSLGVPDAVEDVSVGVHPQHDVLHGGVVDEGSLEVDEEDVGHPDLLHQPCVEGATPVAARRESQPVVLPVVSQGTGSWCT